MVGATEFSGLANAAGRSWRISEHGATELQPVSLIGIAAAIGVGLGGHRHWRTGSPRAHAHVARHPDPHIGGAKPSHSNSDRRDGNARQFLDRQPRSKTGCAAEHRHTLGSAVGAYVAHAVPVVFLARAVAVALA